MGIAGTVLIWLLTLIPFWLYLTARWLMAPTGFWQELALSAVGIFFMGFLQLFLLIVGIALTVSLWGFVAEDRSRKRREAYRLR